MSRKWAASNAPWLSVKVPLCTLRVSKVFIIHSLLFKTVTPAREEIAAGDKAKEAFVIHHNGHLARSKIGFSALRRGDVEGFNLLSHGFAHRQAKTLIVSPGRGSADPLIDDPHHPALFEYR
jgi:hypothetical protein